LTLPNGDELETIELLWNDNKVGESCIPAGIYKFKRDRAGRHQWWKILDVTGRTHIEIHEGSKPSHSEGCILMSKHDLVRMLDFFDGDETYILEIT
jgi:hypothetical protein